MIKVLISGYHGFENCGDEAILLAMKSNIQKLDCPIHITALSLKPENTKLAYGIDAIQRFDFWKVLFAIRRSDILLSGGGSLLQDETSTRSLLYYLGIIAVAKLLGKKVMLYSNGIGPVSKSYNRFFIKRIINYVDMITLREEASRKELQGLNITRPPIYVTADPAFTLDGISNEEAVKVLQKENIPYDRPLMGVSVRAWKNSEDFIEKMAKLCDWMIEKYQVHVVFIPMQHDTDIKVSTILQQKMKNTSFILRDRYQVKEMLGIVGLFHIVLSMRLHTLIFAGVKRIPMLGFVYDPKVEHYLELLNMPSAGSVYELDLESIYPIIDEMMLNHKKYESVLERIGTKLKEKAEQNDVYLLQLIQKLQTRDREV